METNFVRAIVVAICLITSASGQSASRGIVHAPDPPLTPQQFVQMLSNRGSDPRRALDRCGEAEFRTFFATVVAQYRSSSGNEREEWLEAFARFIPDFYPYIKGNPPPQYDDVRVALAREIVAGTNLSDFRSLERAVEATVRFRSREPIAREAINLSMILLNDSAQYLHPIAARLLCCVANPYRSRSDYSEYIIGSERSLGSGHASPFGNPLHNNARLVAETLASSPSTLQRLVAIGLRIDCAEALWLLGIVPGDAAFPLLEASIRNADIRKLSVVLEVLDYVDESRLVDLVQQSESVILQTLEENGERNDHALTPAAQKLLDILAANDESNIRDWIGIQLVDNNKRVHFRQDLAVWALDSPPAILQQLAQRVENPALHIHLKPYAAMAAMMIDREVGMTHIREFLRNPPATDFNYSVRDDTFSMLVRCIRDFGSEDDMRFLLDHVQEQPKAASKIAETLLEIVRVSECNSALLVLLHFLQEHPGETSDQVGEAMELAEHVNKWASLKTREIYYNFVLQQALVPEHRYSATCLLLKRTKSETCPVVELVFKDLTPDQRLSIVKIVSEFPEVERNAARDLLTHLGQSTTDLEAKKRINAILSYWQPPIRPHFPVPPQRTSIPLFPWSHHSLPPLLAWWQVIAFGIVVCAGLCGMVFLKYKRL